MQVSFPISNSFFNLSISHLPHSFVFSTLHCNICSSNFSSSRFHIVKYFFINSYVVIIFVVTPNFLILSISVISTSYPILFKSILIISSNIFVVSVSSTLLDSIDSSDSSSDISSFLLIGKFSSSPSSVSVIV
ncbi:hypothetical protein GLOIN_2v1825275 [Rhizophagus irregularis DAOM 181602=DAOM 197198]|uniref:Uncharacterized protein n=1 Tax=Rhizophagus irregularis (strain DAOM 181602 / DAOM 197198 / MUCL 43194) TaxID=747089 RepID=A0A2P4NVS2_RHIID|nr:hypothetical protein GLOIN_2v1825275 [Rhizophagus irregularis DAOM 181602=DAOM 197198]POG57245.1 hypothetical protein GLOIN_2v1825275 [Rhizophagus irregularis DAOM 181602=DAOM 197198]|eukprot:XP_025164396.1 hypothetical protein GLOIN_2v1825275 [Rhizophagus irregularis DAOM 181602=DAOM 197198]